MAIEIFQTVDIVATRPTSSAESSAVEDAEVIFPNFNRHFTGISATVANLCQYRECRFRAVLLGQSLPVDTPHVSWRQLLRGLWRPPAGRTFRIWHARRNSEMLTGLLLKHVLRAPIRLVFTTVALRRHSALPRQLIRAMEVLIATTAEAASHVGPCAAIVPHMVNTEHFTPPDDKRLCWQKSGLPGRYGIGMFGRVRPQKGTDLFVEAMCRLLPRFPDFTAVISGRWHAKDAAFQRSLANKVEQAGLRDRVVWLGDLPAAQRHVWFQRISLCVAAPRYEPYGLTPLEAMASGCAVVATRTGIFPTLIEDGKTGFVVDAADVDALTARIEQCLSDPEMIIQMGSRGRQHVLQRYDHRVEAAAIEQVYQRIFDGEL